MNTLNSISERVNAGQVHCEECGAQAQSPVSGWAFIGARAYCPSHVPLGMDFGPLPKEDTADDD